MFLADCGTYISLINSDEYLHHKEFLVIRRALSLNETFVLFC